MNLKNLFLYQKIETFLKNYRINKFSDINKSLIENMKLKKDIYLHEILKNKQEFRKGKNILEIEHFKFGKNNLGELLCPENFGILDKNSFILLSKILNIKEDNGKKKSYYMDLIMAK